MVSELNHGDARLRLAARWRPFPGELACGDAAFVARAADGWLVALIDGLGHGPRAAEAAEAILAALGEAQPEGAPLISPETALIRADVAARETRGAALAALSLRGPELAFAGVGNIALRTTGLRLGFASTPGILGRRARIRLHTGTWDERSWIILHSDGISLRAPIPPSLPDGPAELAETWIREHGKDHDDASIIVIAPPRAGAP